MSVFVMPTLAICTYEFAIICRVPFFFTLLICHTFLSLGMDEAGGVIECNVKGMSTCRTRLWHMALAQAWQCMLCVYWSEDYFYLSCPATLHTTFLNANFERFNISMLPQSCLMIERLLTQRCLAILLAAAYTLLCIL